jgi:large subunit ribosomal protein L6
MEKERKNKKLSKERKSFNEEIEIPSQVNASIGNNVIIIKKDSKELKRKIESEISASIEGNKIKLEVKNARRIEKRKFGSLVGHIKNMIKGLVEGFEYDLEICNVHFPMTLTFDKAKSEFIVKNMLGEKSPRTLKTNNRIEVEIKAPHIKIKSYDLEAAGQAASDLEKLTKIRYRDRNKFQDGIFITKKPGKSYI